MAAELQSLLTPQWGIESSMGGNITCSRIFVNILEDGLDINPDQKKEARGIAGIPVLTEENLVTEMCKGTVKCVFDYVDLGYILASRYGVPTTTTPQAGVKLHVFEMPIGSKLVPQTYTLETADGFSGAGGGRAGKANGVVFDGFKIQTDPEKRATLDATLIGKEVQDPATVSIGGNDVQTVTLTGASAGTFKLIGDGVTSAAIAFNATAGAVQTAVQALGGQYANTGVAGSAGGPYTLTTVTNPLGLPVALLTSDATALTGTVAVAHTTIGGMKINTPAPFVLKGSEVSVAFATTLAGLDSAPTAIVDEYATSIDIGAIFDAVWRQNPTDANFGEYAQKKPDQIKDSIDLTLAYNAVAGTLIASSKQNTRMFVRLKFTSPQTIGVTGVPYSIQFDSSVFVTWTDNKTSQGNLRSISVRGDIRYDMVSNLYSRWSLTNAVASYTAN